MPESKIDINAFRDKLAQLLRFLMYSQSWVQYLNTSLNQGKSI
ncbi:hypothetical protein RintRC_0882 [Richelia intracellularis]|nr:hypothetical protein RintRC_0882 [Richelia intracellularis]